MSGDGNVGVTVEGIDWMGDQENRGRKVNPGYPNVPARSLAEFVVLGVSLLGRSVPELLGLRTVDDGGRVLSVPFVRVPSMGVHSY